MDDTSLEYLKMIVFSKLSIKSNSAFFLKMVRPFYPCNWGKMCAARGKTGYWPFLHEDSVSERVNYHVTFVFIIGQISLVILLVRFAGAEKRISGRNNLFYRRTNSSPALVVSYAGLRRPTSYAGLVRRGVRSHAHALAHAQITQGVRFIARLE